jgi:peptide/nickel transport system substrate-binding protein
MSPTLKQLEQPGRHRCRPLRHGRAPRRTRLAAALAALAALAAGGCGSAPPAAAPATLVVEANPVSPMTDDFNPFEASSLGSEVGAVDLFYEPLLQWNITKADAYYPWLATGFAWNAGGTAITFRIRSGVRWSDGRPLTAADVAYTFQLMQNDQALNAQALPITGATSSGDEATITFSSPQYTNLYAISGQTFIVPEHIWRSRSDPAGWSDPDPVGSGAYLLDALSPQGFTLKANPDYWGGPPKVSKISFPAYVSNAAANQALADGQIDWAANYVPGIQTAYVARDPATDHYWFATTNTVTLIFNTATAPFDSRSVRQAVSAGIDRGALAQVGESGYEPAATSSSGLLLPEFAADVPAGMGNDLPSGPDALEVDSIMTDAGYAKDSAGVWAQDGVEISFAIDEPSSYTDYYTDATLIAQQLQGLGFNVTVQNATVGSWTSDLDTGNFQAAIRWGASGPTPYTQYEAWLDYGGSAPLGQNAGGDFGRYDNPAVQSALRTWAGTDDPAVITQQIDLIADAMTSDVPDAVLLYGAGWNEYSTAKFTGWPTQSNPYINPQPNDPWDEYTVLHLVPVS